MVSSNRHFMLGGMGCCLLVIGICVMAMPCRVAAKDYRVVFIKEQFKETKAESQNPKDIYHTWYVTSDAGDKLLVLQGEDAIRRNWLREFSQQFDQFLVQVPDAETGAFESHTIFKINVDNIHPIDQATIEKVKAEKEAAAQAAKKGAKGKKAKR